MGQMAPMLIMLAVSAAFAIAAVLLAPKPKSKFDAPDYSFPTSDEGAAIPVPIGTVDCTGQYIWPKDAASAVKETVAHQVDSGGKGFGGSSGGETHTYRLSWAVCLGWGPIDRIIEVRASQCAIWRGPLDYEAADFPNGYADLTVGNGLVRFYWGTQTQAPDPILAGILGDVPSWKGMCWMLFHQYDVGTSPSVPQITVRMRRIPQSPLSNTHKLILTDAGSGSNCEIYEANPVHVIADVMTNTHYGAGLPAAKLDSASWNAAAATVASEQLGISTYLKEQETLQSFVENILSHIDAGVVVRNGILHLKLQRRDYNPDTVTVIPEQAVSDFNIESSLPGGLPTQVLVSYTDWRKNFASASFPMFNIGATIDSDSARREQIDLPLFTVRDIAAVAAQSKMQQLMTPHDAVTFTLDRANGIALEWGDVVKLNYTPCLADVTRLWRIISLERSATSARYVEVKAVEELGANRESVDPGEVVAAGEPVTIDGPLTHVKPLELPWDVTGGSLAVTYLAARDQTMYSKFMLYGGLSLELDAVVEKESPFVPAGALSATYAADTLAVDDAGFLIDPTPDVAEFAATASVSRANLFLARNLMVIDNEILAFQIIEAEGNYYRIRGILRGLYDTDPAAHLSGASVFMLRNGKPPCVVKRQAGWANGVTIYTEAVPYTRNQTGALHLFETNSLTLVERARRPFPVANLLANGVGNALSPSYIASNNVRLSWTARTRGAGMGYPNQTGMWENGVAVEGSFVVEIWTGTTLRRTIEVPATALITSGFFEGRLYTDYNPILDYNPASFTARVYSVVNGWRSSTYRSVTVTKA